MFTDEFIKITRNLDLYPRVSNMSIFAPQISSYISKGFYSDESPTPYLVIMKEGDDSFAYLTETKLVNLAKEIFERYWKNTKYINWHKEKIEKYVVDINELYNLYGSEKIAAMPIEELIIVGKKAIQINKQLTTLVWPTIHFDEELLMWLIKEYKIKISENRLREVWHKGTTPSFFSFDSVWHINTLLLLKNHLGWFDIAEKCQYHYANYNSIADLKCVVGKLKKVYGKYSVDEINKLLAKKKNEENKNRENYEKWLKSLSKIEQKLVTYMQSIIRMRDMRKHGVSQTLTFVYRIAEKIFDEAKIENDLISYCACDEILNGPEYLIKNKRNIQKRKKGIAMMFNNDSEEAVRFEYGTFDKIKNNLNVYYKNRQEKTKFKNEFKGQVANGGKATGVVKIIHSVENIKNFTSKNILVTSMTRPEFTPLMKKAAAIITDEGGITCHAAIVSRELGKPCVIGTKIATQVLKNGDIVDVDANTGVVKIIKKYEKIKIKK